MISFFAQLKTRSQDVAGQANTSKAQRYRVEKACVSLNARVALDIFHCDSQAVAVHGTSDVRVESQAFLQSPLFAFPQDRNIGKSA
jgi:hypothetical protein